MSVVFQSLRFGQAGQRLLDHRVPIGPRAHTLQFAKLNRDDFILDADLQPIHHAIQIGIGPSDILAGEVLLELTQYRIVHLEIFVYGTIRQIKRGKVEKDILIEQRVLEVIALGAFNLLVWGDAATTVDSAARIGQLDLSVGRVSRLGTAVAVVVVE